MFFIYSLTPHSSAPLSSTLLQLVGSVFHFSFMFAVDAGFHLSFPSPSANSGRTGFWELGNLTIINQQHKMPQKIFNDLMRTVKPD